MRTSSKLNVSLLVLIVLVLSGIWWELHFHLHPCCRGDKVVLVRPEPVIVKPPKSLVSESIIVKPHRSLVKEPIIVNLYKSPAKEPIIVNPHESLVREPVSINEPKTLILFGAAVIILITINRRINNESKKRIN